MSSNVALSGLKAAQTDLSVTSNNIANVSSYGFHRSRAEFGDLVTSAMNARGQVGLGAMHTMNRQIFTEGNIETTGNSLDLALDGSGFFAMRSPINNNSTVYSRAGAFGMNEDGLVVNSVGDRLLAFPVAADGTPLSRSTTQLNPLQIPQENGTASRTTAVSMELKFPATGQGSQAAVPSTTAFDPNNSATYAYSSPISVLDADGQPQDAMAYWVKTLEPSAGNTETRFAMQVQVAGTVAAPPTPVQELVFDQFGNQTGGTAPTTYVTNTGNLTFTTTNSSLSSSDPFEVASLGHNGTSTEGLATLEIAEDGVVWASYGSNQAIALGQVALATFQNLQGLTQLGSATYAETSASGDPQFGGGFDPGFGALRSGAIETSNVDLTEELVHLITAQRNYQANAKSLETDNTITQTIMNIR